MSSMWTITPLPIRASSWVSSATITGPSTPTIPLRLATEKSTARLA